MKIASLLTGWTLPIVAVGLSVAYALFFFLPTQRTIAELTEQVASQQALVEQTEALSPALAATEEQIHATLQYSAAWEETSPSETSLAALFGQISALAKAAGVTTTRFDPDTPVDLARVRRIPLTIGCTGQFSQVAQFLESVERLPQTIWIANLRMETGRENRKVVQCEARLEIFADNPKISGQVNLSGGPI
jgi:Tfp pilus assembly protein PilO